VRNARTYRIIGGVAAVALLATACGNGLEGDEPEVEGAVDPGGEDLDGASITVGSKDFDEQLVLGHISRILLEENGVDVTDEINLGGTDAARAALETGEIDHYWEYTGTAWISFFGEDEPIPDRVEQYEAVRDREAEENGLYWLEPTPFNNTYGIAYQADAADDLGNPQTISDFFEIAEEDPDLATLCVESEFEARDDGLPGMEEHYGGEVPSGNVTVLDTGVVYSATADRDPCNFGEVFTTDGRIAALDLVVLEDDESFFPLYNVAPVFTEEVYAQYGQALIDLYEPVAAELDDDTMAQLNARVSADNEDPADVARDFLEDIGAI
jgi:osmoprotectant transport system substrate-binding protein